MSFHRIARRAALAAMGCCFAGAVHADVLVGDYRGTGVPSPVVRFADGASGTATPLGAFATNVSDPIPLLSATYMTYEPVENVVYVADFRAQAIRVYPANASGDVARCARSIRRRSASRAASRSASSTTSCSPRFPAAVSPPMRGPRPATRRR